MSHVPGAFRNTLQILTPFLLTIAYAIGTIIPIFKMRRLRHRELIVPRVTSKQVAKRGLDPRQCTLLLTTWFTPFTDVIGSSSEQAQVTPQVSALTLHLEEAAYRIAPLDMAV